MGEPERLRLTQRNQQGNTMSEMKPYGQELFQTMQEGVEAIKKTEPTLIIKSEDLQDPKKLAFVKAIVGSKDVFGDTFIGLGKMSAMRHFVFEVPEGLDSNIFERIKIKISDIKLEPRLLIGEDVEVMAEFWGEYTQSTVRNLISSLDAHEYGRSKGHTTFKPSLQWLKENFEVI